MSQTSPSSQEVTFAYTEADAARIIGTEYGSNTFLTAPTGENLTRNLEKEKKRLIGLELHAITLTEYYKCKRIPRGLRVKLRPTIFQENIEFVKRYEQIVNKCSFDILLLNIEFLQIAIPEVRTQITAIEQNLKDSLQPTELRNLLTRTEETLQRHRKEIKDRKRAKFIRDSEDYRQGSVYQWSGGNGNSTRQLSREHPGYRGERQRPQDQQRAPQTYYYRSKRERQPSRETAWESTAPDSSASTSSSFLEEPLQDTARKRGEETREAPDGQRQQERRTHYPAAPVEHRQQPYRSTKRNTRQTR
ncbi:hypothetical protein XELAEV_18026943mg [Xenopus laevis]|uniref:Uncharacterized protein n=1 Tax=Xenopus laevis TaxID=8355 RepID=A0A974HJI0_XENLA|nr:hypothetical protein XELAEV_18026943mg [Xenopus laevis]